MAKRVKAITKEDMKKYRAICERFYNDALNIISTRATFIKKVLRDELRRYDYAMKKTSAKNKDDVQTYIDFIEEWTGDAKMALEIVEMIQPSRNTVYKGVCYILNKNLLDFPSLAKLHTILDDYKKNYLEPLIKQFKGLVIKMANDMATNSSSFDDLVSMGYIGIIEALNRFDFDKNTKLSTYVYNWIREEMFTQSMSEYFHLYYPKNKKVEFYFSKKDVDEQDRVKMVSLIGENGENLFENLEGYNYNNIEETENRLCWEKIYDLLREKLRDDELEILMKRFGLFGNREHTLYELRDEFGLSPEGARKKIERIIGKIKRSKVLMQAFNSALA